MMAYTLPHMALQVPDPARRRNTKDASMITLTSGSGAICPTNIPGQPTLR